MNDQEVVKLSEIKFIFETKNTNDEEAVKLFEIIKKYNSDKDDAEKIKFIHGGSSVPLTLAGSHVSFLDYKENKMVSKTIPQALIPTGKLRKEYGLYPFSGEVAAGMGGFGIRSRWVNYRSISGMKPSKKGFQTVCEYASEYSTDEVVYQEKILELILQLDEKNCTNFLKQILTNLTKIVTLEALDEMTAKRFLNLIKIEYQHLTRAYPNTREDKRISKYFSRIENILTGNSFDIERSNTLKQEILDRFSVIYCSTTEGKIFRHGEDGEVVHEGELPLSTVKIFFTPKKFVSRLTEVLAKLGIEGEVHALNISNNKKRFSFGESTIDTLDAIKNISKEQFEQTVDLLNRKYCDDLKSNPQFIFEKAGEFKNAQNYHPLDSLAVTNNLSSKISNQPPIKSSGYGSFYYSPTTNDQPKQKQSLNDENDSTCCACVIL